MWPALWQNNLNTGRWLFKGQIIEAGDVICKIGPLYKVKENEIETKRK